MSNISIRLKEIRKKRNLTQKQLAILCGVSRSNIASWENGSRTPTYDNLINLSLQLNVDLNYLCGISDKLMYNMSLVNSYSLSKIDEILKIDIKKRLADI